MIEKLIATLFLSREVTHREHLKAKKHGVHLILEEFYDDILDALDKLAECYQGRNGIIDNIPILTNDRPNTDIVKLLEYHMAVVEKLRYVAISKDDAPVQAIVDEVVMVYLRAIYKLNALK